MVVSTEVSPSTAHSEAPAPRWQVTIASDSTGRPRSLAARVEADGSYDNAYLYVG